MSKKFLAIASLMAFSQSTINARYSNDLGKNIRSNKHKSKIKKAKAKRNRKRWWE